jgi:hypothetical protein
VLSRVINIPNQRPRYNDERSPEYKVIYVSDIFGGHQIDYFEVTVRTISINANDSEKAGEAILDRVEQACLKMSPQQAKLFRDWLSLQINQFETKFGTIAFGEKRGREAVALEEAVDHGEEQVNEHPAGPMYA